MQPLAAYYQDPSFVETREALTARTLTEMVTKTYDSCNTSDGGQAPPIKLPIATSFAFTSDIARLLYDTLYTVEPHREEHAYYLAQCLPIIGGCNSMKLGVRYRGFRGLLLPGPERPLHIVHWQTSTDAWTCQCGVFAYIPLKCSRRRLLDCHSLIPV